MVETGRYGRGRRVDSGVATTRVMLRRVVSLLRSSCNLLSRARWLMGVKVLVGANGGICPSNRETKACVNNDDV